MKYLKMFQQLGNETRMRIVALLMQNELCVCGLEEILHIRQVNISKHLSKLKEANIVDSRREKQRIFYFLTENFINKEHLLKHIEEVMVEDEQIIKDHEALMVHDETKANKIYVCKAFKKENLS